MGRPGDPITKQRSAWAQVATDAAISVPGMEMVGVHERRVHDGTLRAFHTVDLGAHHLSVSFTDHKGRPSRYPTWDELAHARYELLPGDVTMVMVLPPPDEFVAVHRTTFHLHEMPVAP